MYRDINAVLDREAPRNWWERWDAERVARDRAGHAPARVSEARIQLYRDGAAVLAAHREQEEAEGLVARWRAILHAECGGDEEMAAEQIRASRHRHDWPPGLAQGQGNN